MRRKYPKNVTLFQELKHIRKPIIQVTSSETDSKPMVPLIKKEVSTEYSPSTKNFQQKHPHDKFQQKHKCTNRGAPDWTPTSDPLTPPKQNLTLNSDSGADLPTHSYTLRTCRKPATVRFNP